MPCLCPGLRIGQNLPRARVSCISPVLEASEPHTVEMHQPRPTKPTCSHTRGPDTCTVPATAATSPRSTPRGHAAKLEPAERRTHACPPSQPVPQALPTFSCRTRSMRYLQRGLMSLRMRAVMMSIPLDSWVTMQLWGAGSNATCYPMDAASPPRLHPPTRLRSETVPCLQH